jgi:hypothetical protein
MDTHIYTATIQYDLEWDIRLDNWIQSNINRIQDVTLITRIKYLSDEKIMQDELKETQCSIDDKNSLEKYIKNRINYYKNQ